MKHLIAIVGILAALCLMNTTSQAQSLKNHELSLKGMTVPSSARGTLMLVGKSQGSLPGSFEIFIWYNPVTNKVTGGTWKLAVPQQGRAAKAQGSLAGLVTGGTVTLDQHGRVNSIDGVQISIRRSVGQYSRVGKGSGRVSGTLDLRRQHPFKGELQISFG